MSELLDRYDVFLSYSTRDESIASELKQLIESAGLKCFMASEDLLVGTKWKPRIREAIRRSDRILLLITPRSINSRWVLLETGAAWMEDKPLIAALQFVEPNDLITIAQYYQFRRIETDAQKAMLLAEIQSPPDEQQLTFAVLLSKIKSAADNIVHRRIFPKIVIGSGRDGAIVGGFFAEQFARNELKIVGMDFIWRGTTRTTEIDTRGIEHHDVRNRAVLVVEWARESGGTFALIEKHLGQFEPASLHSYAVFWTGKSPSKPDYYGFKRDEIPLSPWAKSTPTEMAR
jgi:hypoxanthine phosphoribosyltransferase